MEKRVSVRGIIIDGDKVYAIFRRRVNDYGTFKADYVLHNKDRVRIITDILSYGPREEWLDKVKTTKAKRKINEFNKI